MRKSLLLVLVVILAVTAGLLFAAEAPSFETWDQYLGGAEPGKRKAPSRALCATLPFSHRRYFHRSPRRFGTGGRTSFLRRASRAAERRI